MKFKGSVTYRHSCKQRQCNTSINTGFAGINEFSGRLIILVQKSLILQKQSPDENDDLGKLSTDKEKISI